MLRTALLKEKLINSKIKNHINHEYHRIISVLQSKSDPMGFTMSQTIEIDLIRGLFNSVFSREEAIEIITLVGTDKEIIIQTDRNGKIIKETIDQEKNYVRDVELSNFEQLVNASAPEIVIALSGRTYTGSPFFQEGIMHFKVAVPVEHLGIPIGAIIVNINIEKLWTYLRDEILRPGVITYLIDSHGRLLVSPPALDLHRGEFTTHLGIVRSIISHEAWDQVETYSGLNKESVFGVGSYISSLDWGLVTEIPKGSIIKPIIKPMLSVAGIVFVVVVLLSGIGLFLVRKLLKPFNLFFAAFDRVSRGDYTTNLKPSYISEIDAIVTGFNSMQDKINRREIDIKENETKYRLLVETANDTIIVLNVETRIIIDASIQIEDLIGIPVSGIIGRHYSCLFPDDEKVLINKIFEKYIQLDKSVTSEEIYVKHKDGHKVPVEISSSVFELCGEKVIMGIFRNISERRKAKERISRFGQLLEDSMNEIYIINAGTLRFIEVNHGARVNLGYSMEELVNLTPLDLKPEFTLESFTKLISPLRTGKQKMIVFETAHRRKDGSMYDVEVHLQFGIFESVPAFTAIILDITKRREMEIEILKAQKLESIGVLAGGIAHDFNNILTVIHGNTTLAIMSSKPEGEIYKILKNIEKASIRATDLTKQLLTFSKGGAPVKKLISISKLINESVKFALRGSNVKAEINISEDLWQVDADRGQITQVINNLVINSKQAMPQGGMLNVSAENVSGDTLDNSLLTHGKYVRISVEDIGIGMSKDILSHIFDPYFTTKQEGSGLGLASSYSIIKNHGGLITVRSELGVGTRFQIYLPASSKIITEKKGGEYKPITGNGKILIMDDDAGIRDMMSHTLSFIGYDVKCAKDGVETIKLYNESKRKGKPFDVIIMDLTIPGLMGGEETIKKLREKDLETKVIVSSGYSNNKIMANYKEYGFNGILSKPFEIHRMSEVIQTVING